jgi:signal peptidase II
MAERRSTAAIVACFIALALLTALDLGTKAWAVRELSHPVASPAPVCTPDQHGRYYQRLRTQSIVVVENYLELRYAENCGAAFGLLDRSPRWLRASLFTVAGVAAIGALLWMFVRARGGALFAWSVPLVVSGALGNMVDRLRLGYVVDFIYFHIYDRFEWPTFNVADATIAIGVGLLLLDGLKRPEPEPVVASGGSTRPEKA